MKHLTLITHTDAQQSLTDQLRKIEQVSGYTFSHVEGHGIEPESDPFLSARDKVVGVIPRLRVDILLQDNDVEATLEMLRDTNEHIKGQGIYWVTNVEQNGHL